MKFPIIWLLVVNVVNWSSVHGFADPNAVRIIYNRSTPKCTKVGPECADDCQTLMFCSAFNIDDEPMAKITCTVPTPYCVNGACSSSSGSCKPGAGSGDSTFQCTDEGIFPDPSDCTRFHMCEADGTTETFQCDNGFVFNSILKLCQIGKTPCTKIGCSKASEENTFIPYASNPAYYAFCMKGNFGFQTLMFKCPYDEFEVFDVKAKQCQFKCKAKGNFQDPGDCEKYVYCSGANAQPITLNCPTKWVFDGTKCNKDVDECKHKPLGSLSPTKPGGLSPSKAVDSDVSNLINPLKATIIEKMCDPNPDKPTCIADAVIRADNFRMETVADVTNYFVSITDTNTNNVYHVKIITDTNKQEVDSVVPKTAADEIEAF